MVKRFLKIHSDLGRKLKKLLSIYIENTHPFMYGIISKQGAVNVGPTFKLHLKY